MARAAAFLRKQSLLCLPPATGQLPEEGGIIISSPALPERKQIEHAGHCYQQRLIRSYAIHSSAGEEDVNNSDSSNDSPTNVNSKSNTNRLDSTDAAKALASKMAVGSDDLYELLELGDKRWHATADDIKKNFRRISLLYHPDKISHQGEEARQNSETHFKAAKKAYDILSDKKKRAAYDSIDDVDDSIPSEKDASGSPERFYEKFGPCFAINARWSVSNRVPDLGDDDTDVDTVNRFYDFWYSFKSWRDFSFDLEYNIDQAESREEKRWMDRQNAKHIKVKKLEENTRIRRLVDLAYKHDPRLKRVRQEAKAKKDAEKKEKARRAEEAARQAKEESERKRIESERIAAEDKARRAEAKKQKDAARQVLRKARQKLRTIGMEIGLMLSDKGSVAVETMCTKGTVQSIEALTQFLSSLSPDAQNKDEIAHFAVEKALADPQSPIVAEDVTGDFTRSTDENEQSTKSEQTTAASSDSNSEINQSSEDNESESPSKSNGTANTEKTDDKPWTQEELSLLSKGVAKYPGGTRGRWERLAQFIGTRTAEEVLCKVNSCRPSNMKAAEGRASSIGNNDERAFGRFQEKKKGKPVVPRGNGASAPNDQTTQQSSRVSQPPNKFQFTPKQQQLFEAALKKYPSTQGAQRWKLIAAAVGRTPEHCQLRFNELIAYYRSKKASS